MTKGPAEPTDPLVKVSNAERKAWKRQREKRELTTRQLAALAGTSNGTISNIERGKHRQIKRSLYISLVRALFRPTPEAVADLADQALERSHRLVRRLAQISVVLDDDELEDWASLMENRAKSKER